MNKIENITREEQIEAEFFVYESADACGILPLKDFKEQILGTTFVLRMAYHNVLKMNHWLKINGFDVSQPFEIMPENCVHPYYSVYRKGDFERCGKCNKVLCEG